jgi:hypothetical protein
MVMVVADAIFEASRRSRGLNATDEAFGDQDAQAVVHRLQRDGPDLGPDRLGHRVGGDMGLSGYGAKYRQPLGRDLNAASAEEIGWTCGHIHIVSNN